MNNPLSRGGDSLAGNDEFYGLKPDGLYLSVKVTPGASREVIGPAADGVLNVKLTARPVDGKANQALIKAIAKHLKVRKSAIEIIRGEKSRIKTVRISDLNVEDALKKFNT